MTENVALALTVVTLITALGTWWKWGRPKLMKARQEATAMRDAILGREPIVDSITGRELAPALPGIGVRQARTEDSLALLTTAVAKLADSQTRIDHIETRVDSLDADVADLKARTLEKIMAHAEATQAWSAVEAVAKSTPPDPIEE